MEAAEYGFVSIIPIIITLGIAIWTQNVIIGLFSGVFVGVITLNGFNPVNTISLMVSDYLSRKCYRPVTPAFWF